MLFVLKPDSRRFLLGFPSQAAMNNIVSARCYTSDNLEQLLLEAASLMVNDEDRNLVDPIHADELQC